MLRTISTTLLNLCLLSTGAVADSRPDSQAAMSHAPVTVSPTVRGLEQARRRSDGAVVAEARIEGAGTVEAVHVIIEGVLSPGNSPGCISFGGNVTFSLTATLLTEIGGTIPCTEFDRIDVGNQLTINGATLEVVLINGFIPAYGDSFDIMDWGSISGTFGSIDTSAASLPYPLQWDSSQLYVTGELVVVVQQIADGNLAPWNSPDTNIDAADILIAMQLALGLRTPGILQLAHGDMNGDGVINLVDVLQIQKVVLP